MDDGAFLSLPAGRTFEHLRILDLTSCARITDRAVERIIDAAPRLRNLVLAKCRNITDQAVFAISRLGKNLHYVHLGHCVNLTDEAVKRLVHCCNRIRYIDLGCCTHLTDESVTRLAVLPKLKRIGLVKCNNITDASVYALAKANQRYRQRKDAEGREYNYSSGSSLERVHLSYCTQLTLKVRKKAFHRFQVASWLVSKLTYYAEYHQAPQFLPSVDPPQPHGRPGLPENGSRAILPRCASW